LPGLCQNNFIDTHKGPWSGVLVIHKFLLFFHTIDLATIMGVQENPFFNIYILDVFL